MQEHKNRNVKDMQGNLHRMGDLFGKTERKLLVFAAEWCPHCLKEENELQRFINENPNKKDSFSVFFTEYRSSYDVVVDFYKSKGYTFNAYYDFSGDVSDDFDVQGFPSNFIINNGELDEFFIKVLHYDDFKKLF